MAGASYPDNIKQFNYRTDNVDKVVAYDVNVAYDEITAIQTQLGQGGVVTSTWSGTFQTTTLDWTNSGGLKARLLNLEAGVKAAVTSIDGGTPTSA